MCENVLKSLILNVTVYTYVNVLSIENVINNINRINHSSSQATVFRRKENSTMKTEKARFKKTARKRRTKSGPTQILKIEDNSVHDSGFASM